MEITVNRKAFLALVKGFSAKRSTLRILESAVLSVDGSELTIWQTDLDVETERRMICGTTERGAAVVNVAWLKKRVAAIRGELITLQTSEGATGATLTLSDERSRTSTLTSSPAEYPGRMPVGETTATIERLVRAAKLVHPAISKDETRPNLLGVRVEAGALVATDGHRVNKIWTRTVEGGIVAPFVVPRQALAQLIKLADVAKPVTISRSGSFVTLRQPGLSITTKLLEVSFPDLKFVWAAREEAATTVVMNRGELIAAVKFVETSARGGEQAKIVFELGEDEVTLRATNDEGDVSDERLVANVTSLGGDKVFGIHPRYVNDMLKCLAGDSVNMELSTATAPVFFTGGEEDVFVIMPKRID